MSLAIIGSLIWAWEQGYVRQPPFFFIVATMPGPSCTKPLKQPPVYDGPKMLFCIIKPSLQNKVHPTQLMRLGICQNASCIWVTL